MEDKNSVLDSLMRRKKALESLLSQQKRRTSRRQGTGRSSSNDDIAETKTNNPKKPSYQSKKQQNIKKCNQTSVKTSTESVDFIENRDFETPVKGRLTRSSSNDNVAVTKTSNPNKPSSQSKKQQNIKKCNQTSVKTSTESVDFIENRDFETPVKRRLTGSSSNDNVAVTKTSNPNKPSSQSKKQQNIKKCNQTSVKTSTESVDFIENRDFETPVKRRLTGSSSNDNVAVTKTSNPNKPSSQSKKQQNIKKCNQTSVKTSTESVDFIENRDFETPVKRRLTGSSSDENVAVSKTSNPNKSSCQSKKQQKAKKCNQTPVKTSIESVDFIENSDVETPVKMRHIQRTCTSPDDTISTSTIRLSRSHNFFKTPETTPIKNISSLLFSESELAFNYNTPLTSRAAQDFQYYLPGVGPNVDSEYKITVNAHSAADDVHHYVPDTGSESAARPDDSPVAAHTAADDAHHYVPDTGSESAARPDDSPVAAHTAADDAHHYVPDTGSESAARPDDSPVAAHTAADDAHHYVPDTGSESAARPDDSPVAAHTAADDAHHYVPDTGSESAARPDDSPVAAHTAADDAHHYVPDTGSESAARPDDSPVAAHTAADDAHHYVPDTGSESAARPDDSPVIAHTAADDAHHYVPDTGSESAARPDDSPVAAHTAADDAHHYVPDTGSESAARPDDSPVAAHTAADDAHHYVPDTGSESSAPVDSSTAFTHVVMDDVHRHFPSTGPELIGKSPAVANHSSSQQKRKRRRATKSFKKSCMDFLSDEEQEDFSAGSSDLWSCSDSSTSSYDEQSKKKKKRRKIQNKNDGKEKEQSEEPFKDAEVSISKRKTKVNERKINQSLKNEGKEYVTPKGTVIAAKSMKNNPCVPEKCKRGCYEISEDRRRSIFTFYWSLDVKRRRDWLVHCARVDGVRRKRVESNRRKITVDYFINYNEDHKKVCQKFLLCTLDITQRHLNNIISNAVEGMSQKDLRKRTAESKYSESAKEGVRKFIENLPACPSHYNRKKSKRMYLPQDLRNLTNLFRIYRESCKDKNEESVSESMFREIFNKEYDLGFHSPKKDKCIMCTKAENMNEEMTEEEKETLKEHKEEKEASYKRFKAHQTLKDAKTVCSSFDLQKVLNTPYGESMLLYYARKYAVFNFTVYESITQNVYCYTWGECDGKRGSNEIATCLYYYLKELDHQGIETALLYCDSCTGQNKNRVVLSVLNYFLLKSDNLQVIQINYLLPGHTYMPADSVHATIESEVKKIIVWSPTEWPSYFQTARKKPKPYTVNVMEHTDFINWDDLAAKTFTKETSKNIKFKSIRTATFKKKNLNKMEIKYSMKETAVSEKVTLFENKREGKIKGKGMGKGKGKKADEPKIGQTRDADYLQELYDINMQQSYTDKLPIAALKYKDLKKLCTDGTIPKRFHKVYLEMPCSTNKNDTLIETDEEDVDDMIE